MPNLSHSVNKTDRYHGLQGYKEQKRRRMRLQPWQPTHTHTHTADQPWICRHSSHLGGATLLTLLLN